MEPAGWVERSDTHHVIQQGDGFREVLNSAYALHRGPIKSFDTSIVWILACNRAESPMGSAVGVLQIAE